MSMTTATKRCPGFAPDGTLPHEVPADLEHFNSNRGSKDGLATRCKPCGNKYGKAWAAAKAKGESFSVKANVPLVAVLAEEPVPDPDPVAEREALEREAIDEPRAGEPSTLNVASVKSGPTYHDDLAVRAARGKAPGYQPEEVDGVIYALPVNGTATDTGEGQAALAAVNAARDEARRKRQREAKRTQRANAKAKAAQA
jgi:hypothetical protein